MEPHHIQSMDRAIDYIQQHLAEKLPIKTLANVACFSDFHFQRLFKAYTGEAVQKYINRLRLEKAAEALRARPDQSITQIALSSGFATSAAFAKAFQQRFLMSPFV